jgi:dihydrofolate synthase/folylpolyglutamate synthase
MSSFFSPPASDADRAATALERLGTLHPKLIDLSLDRVWRLLDALGNPQDRLAPVIHIAGTNGKGSTQAFLRACLQAAGLKVQAYISPHLVHFNERIRLADGLISDGALADLLEQVEQVNKAQPITFFEVTTAAAFAAFAANPADVVLLETGLGGRLDATNVIARPAVTVLTPIGMDHEQFLGNRLDSIALEKSHIIKSGIPCISARQDAAAAAVIRERAQEMAAPLFTEGQDFTAHRNDAGQLVFEMGDTCWTLPAPALPGAHQLHNAALALATLVHLPDTCPLATPAPDALAEGMRSVSWPARLQRLTQGPLAESLPPGWELWLDGAHNPQAGQMLAQTLIDWRAQDPHRPTDLIMGMMGPKDAHGFFRPLHDKIHRLRAVPVPQEPNAKLPQAVAQAATEAGFSDVAVCPDVATALNALLTIAKQDNSPPRRLLICGSLYLAGTVLVENS